MASVRLDVGSFREPAGEEVVNGFRKHPSHGMHDQSGAGDLCSDLQGIDTGYSFEHGCFDGRTALQRYAAVWQISQTCFNVKIEGLRFPVLECGLVFPGGLHRRSRWPDRPSMSCLVRQARFREAHGRGIDFKFPDPSIARMQRWVEQCDAGKRIRPACFRDRRDCAAERAADAVMDLGAPCFYQYLLGDGCQIIGESSPVNAFRQRRGIGFSVATRVDGEYSIARLEQSGDRFPDRSAEAIGVVQQRDGSVTAPVEAADADGVVAIATIRNPPLTPDRFLHSRQRDASVGSSVAIAKQALLELSVVVSKNLCNGRMPKVRSRITALRDRESRRLAGFRFGSTSPTVIPKDPNANLTSSYSGR